MPHMDKVTKANFSLDSVGECSDDLTDRGLSTPGVIFSNEGSLRAGIADTIYTIEAEVIPRLLISSRSLSARNRSAPVVPSPPRVKVAPKLETEVAILTQIVLLDEAHAAYTFVSSLRARGVSLEIIFLDLLAPTARLLGEMWTEDRCSFSEVTLGLCRLQQVLRQLSTVFDEEPEPEQSASSVLLTPIPGEQHTFGLLMLEEFYRRGGWDTVLLMPGGDREICAAVSRDWFCAAGISVSCSFSHDALRGLIGDMRHSSRNPEIAILVGGRAFGADQELAFAVGADATAVDGREAIVQTHRLVGEMRHAGDRRSG
jgi:methanogenic corrinoid protein MtbC1